jgi:hypothetical protein
MRAMYGAAAVAMASMVSGCESMYVGGIPAYGKLKEVSAAGIKQALEDVGSSPELVSHVAVLNRSEMRLYLRPPYPGYVIARRTDRTAWSDWVRNVYEPEVLSVIKNADDTYIFPLPRPLEPKRDDNRARLLPPNARREISALLGDERSWFMGHWHPLVIEPEPRNVGLIFRRGNSEVMLFFSQQMGWQGTLNGEHIEGLLEDDAITKSERWKRKYAQPELTVK